MDSEGRTALTVLGLIVLIAIASLLVGVMAPYFEAQSFNRVCRAHVSYWDAIWLELRVDNCIGGK